MSTAPALPTPSPMLTEVLHGLSLPQKQLPCKYLYDELGAMLFNAICATPEYYVTRTELQILQQHMHAIVDYIGPHSDIFEFGSGVGEKIQRLLSQLHQPRSYCPIDISTEVLHASAQQLRQAYPDLAIYPICADYMSPIPIPAALQHASGKRVVFFPGSTISNFAPDQAHEFLVRLASLAGAGGGVLIGVDLTKPANILQAAYDDAAGVTAAFNKNLLARLNRDCAADFDLTRFQHQARINQQQQCVEMHLVSSQAQQVHIAGQTLEFAAGESIHTENSYKYSISQFQHLASQAGLTPVQVWQDPEQLFSVHWLTVTHSDSPSIHAI